MELRNMRHLFVCGSRLKQLSTVERMGAVRNMAEWLRIFWIHELNQATDVVVFSGDADGADNAAWRFAEDARLAHFRVAPAWANFRHAAGPIRNSWMVELLNKEATAIAFWDGESTGTKNAIDLLRYKGIEPTIIDPREL